MKLAMKGLADATWPRHDLGSSMDVSIIPPWIKEQEHPVILQNASRK
jgi:hypothetical protein